MTRVFVSYSSLDRQLVARIVSDLETAGYGVWFDQELSGGQRWWDVILDQLRAADVLLYALTEASISSPACHLEAEYATSIDKTVIPVRLTAVSLEQAPSFLQGLQWVDYRTIDAAATLTLVRALNSVLTRPLPDPLPPAPGVPLSYLAELVDRIDSPTTLAAAEQAWVLLMVRQHVADVDDREQLIALATRFRQRGDLLAAVASDLDQLLAQLGTPKAPSDATTTPAKNSTTTSMDKPAEKATHRRRRFVALVVSIAVLAVGALAILLVASGGTDDTPAAVGGKKVEVSASEAFTDTGITLQGRDDVTIDAHGTIDNGTELVGPDGDSNRELKQFNLRLAGGLLPGSHAALVARIGEQGTPFVVGSHSQFVVPNSGGTLFLGVNDAGVDNNSGHFTANVVVHPPTSS